MVQEHWGIKFKPKQGLRIARRVLGLERRGFRRRALYTLLNRASGLELRNSTLDFFRQTNPLGGYPGSRPLPRRRPRLSATGTSGVVAVLDTDLTGRPPYWRTLKAHNSRNTHPISTGLLNRVTAECPLSGKGVENQIGVKKF
ncbi:hypothetical protein ACJJTC_018917 [Scirpophaga incertulas]